MNIQINQLGYTAPMHKTAVLRGSLADTASILDEAGKEVLCVPVEKHDQPLWGDHLASADFSALTAPGIYTMRCGEECSHPFPVSASPYQACLTALVDTFYYQRCGTALGKEVGNFAHAACHDGLAAIYGTDEKIDVTGGWHDAGDYGRYIVAAAKAVADLLLAWQWNRQPFEHPGLTPLLDEARWELEWMLKMQRADGGVYHKVTCASFCDMDMMPDAEREPLVICPVSTPATADFAACMAMAARTYEGIDTAFAQQMKQAAIRAWDFINSHDPMLFRNPEGVVTGEYGDPAGDADERMWAHVEMALTFGDEKYHQAAIRAIAGANRTSAPLGWEDMSGYAAIEGCQLPGETGDLCRQWIIDAAETMLKKMNLYGITMTDALPWGSNMIVADDGMLLVMAARLTGEARFTLAAETQLHYLLGVNPVGYCYVTGFGAQPVEHPHHRPSVTQGKAQPGMLSGGPDSGLDDPCAAELLAGQPAGKCFVDAYPSYSTNEITIYWNSPMVALIAGLTAP